MRAAEQVAPIGLMPAWRAPPGSLLFLCFTVSQPEDCGRILDEALALPGPVIVEAVVDPHEPPFPPKVSSQQMLHFAEALLRGEPDRDTLAKTVLLDKVREMI